jgi:hypothetical protein
MPRRVKFDFFQVELPEDARRTFAQILEAIAGAGNFRDRNVDTADGYTRLQELERVGENFLGTMIRGRENDLPLKTDRDGAVGPLPIGPAEGLGEETSFLFSTRHPALVLQVNRDGTRAGAFATYFTRLSDIPVTLSPIIDPDAMARFQRMTLLRSFEYRLAPGEGLTAQQRQNVAVSTALTLRDHAGAAKIDVSIGLGHRRGYLNGQWVRSTVRALRRVVGGEVQADVERLVVGGRAAEDQPYEVLDLIQQRVVAAAPVQDAERRISREDCWRVLQRVYDGERARLREHFGPDLADR